MLWTALSATPLDFESPTTEASIIVLRGPRSLDISFKISTMAGLLVALQDNVSMKTESEKISGGLFRHDTPCLLPFVSGPRAPQSSLSLCLFQPTRQHTDPRLRRAGSSNSSAPLGPPKILEFQRAVCDVDGHSQLLQRTRGTTLETEGASAYAVEPQLEWAGGKHVSANGRALHQVHLLLPVFSSVTLSTPPDVEEKIGLTSSPGE